MNRVVKNLIIFLIGIVVINIPINAFGLKEDERKEFYSKFVESVNTNEGVRVSIVKSDKYGDFQDEYVSVDVLIKNLNIYSDLDIKVEAIENENFKNYSRSRKLVIGAGKEEAVSFDYTYNKPTRKYNPKERDVKFKKDLAYIVEGEVEASSSYVGERYRREKGGYEGEDIDTKDVEQSKLKRKGLILALIVLSMLVSILVIYFIRRYIRENNEFYHIFFIIVVSIVLILSIVFTKTTYAYTHQTFIKNTEYSHTYTCEVWHGGVAYTFRYRVSYKYVSDIPTFEEDLDTDSDGLYDNYEIYYMTDINSEDTDGDGINDYEEIYIIDTDPLKVDTDEDNIYDSEEDYDGDKLTNIEEKNLGTMMNEKDTDFDGLSDYEEVKVYNTNPLEVDTDNDGLSDYEEVEIAKRLGVEDVLSIDTSIKSHQTLSRDNIDKELYMNNTIKVSVEGNVSGLIDKHIELKYARNASIDNIESILGKAMFLESDYRDEEVVVKFDCEKYKERLLGLTVATIDRGKIKFLDITVEGEVLSAKVSRGYVFLIDGIKYVDNIFTYKKGNYK